MRRGAEVVPEDRVLPVLTSPRVADVASVQAAGELEPPVPATRGLEQVSADGAHVPKLRARREPAGLPERVGHLRTDLELTEGRPGPDPRPVDPARNDAAHVHERLRLEQPVAKKRHHLSPAT